MNIENLPKRETEVCIDRPTTDISEKQIPQPEDKIKRKQINSGKRIGKLSRPIIIVFIFSVLAFATIGTYFGLRNAERKFVYQGKTELLSGNWENAIDQFTKAIEFKPAFDCQTTALAQAYRGEAYFYLGEYEKALADAENALNQDPDLLNTYKYTLAINLEAGDLENVFEQSQILQTQDDNLGFPFAYEGYVHYHNQDYEKALSMIDKALTIDPTIGIAYRVKGAIAIWQYKYEDAVFHLNNALNFNPNDIEAQALLAIAFGQLEDKEAMDAALEKAIQLNPDSAYTLLAQAYQHLINHENKEAIQTIDKALTLEKNRPEFYLIKSSCYSNYVDRQIIKDSLDKIIELNPDFPPGILEKIHFDIMMSQNSTVEDDINRLISLAPKYRFKDFLNAKYLASSYQYEKALKSASNIVAGEPEYLQGYILRGYIYMNLNKWKEAEADFDMALEKFPDSSLPLIGKAHILIEREEFDAALKILDDLQENFPDNTDIYSLKSEIFIEINEPEKHNEMLNILTELDPDDPYLHLMKMYDHLMIDDTLQAMVFVNDALKVTPENAELHLAKAVVYMTDEQYDQARECINKAMHLAPENVGNHEALMALNLGMENYDAALAEAGLVIKDKPWSAEAHYIMGVSYLDKQYEDPSKPYLEDGLKHLKKAIRLNKDMDEARYALAQALWESGEIFDSRNHLEYIVINSDDITLIEMAESHLEILDNISNNGDGTYSVKLIEQGVQFNFPSGWWVIPEYYSLGNESYITLTNGFDETSIFFYTLPADIPYISAYQLAELLHYGYVENYPGYQSRSMIWLSNGLTSGVVHEYMIPLEDYDGEIINVEKKSYYFINGRDCVIIETSNIDHVFYEILKELNLEPNLITIYSDQMEILAQSFEFID
jgi:tetratricopeptide (TPR) repeat protein